MNSVIKKVFLATLITAMLIAIVPSMTMVKAQYQSIGDVLVAFPSGTPTTTYAYSAYETTPTSYYYPSSVYTLTPPFEYGDPPSAQPADPTPGIVTLPSLPSNTEGYYLVQIFGSFKGFATVYVPYNPALYPNCKPRLCVGDPVDFTGSGVVNLVDVILMLQAIKMFQSGTLSPNGIAEFDLNHDGVVNCADLQIVLQYLFFGLPAHGGRLPWMDITVGWTEIGGTYYVVGVTDHFSVFGVRP
jgi:hypothetical protein